MKKISVILLFCFLCLGLSACDPSWIYQDYEELAANAVSVELIHYNDSRTKVINDLPSGKMGVRSFDFNKMELVETLDEKELDDFLRDWSEIQLWTHWIHSNTPVGMSIRIVYSNGDFDVFSYPESDEALYFGYRYNKRGKVKELIGLICNRDDFVNIINHYFTTKID